ARGAVERGESPIDCVEAAGDFDTPDPGHIETGIIREPTVSNVNLEVSMKIHRSSWIFKRDVGNVPGHIARRKIETSAQRHRRMREITADTETLRDDLARGHMRA